MKHVNPLDVGSYVETYSRAAEILDGLIVARSTSVTPENLDTSDMDGTEKVRGAEGKRIAGAFITVTTSAVASVYATGAGNAIVVTGTWKGETVTDSLVLTDTNGGETIRGDQPFDDPTAVTIAIPAQLLGTGAFDFGVSGVFPPGGGAFRAVKGHAAGSILVQGQDGLVELLPVASHVVEPVVAEAVLARHGATPDLTGVAVTAYR